MRINAASAPVNKPAWDRLSSEIASGFRVKRSPLILRSPNPSILMTWGLLKPTIIVPAGAENWCLGRTTVVFSHELAHIRRFDWLTQLLSDIFRALCWFHPFVWMVCRRLRLESEYAC